MSWQECAPHLHRGYCTVAMLRRAAAGLLLARLLLFYRRELTNQLPQPGSQRPGRDLPASLVGAVQVHGHVIGVALEQGLQAAQGGQGVKVLEQGAAGWQRAVEQGERGERGEAGARPQVKLVQAAVDLQRGRGRETRVESRGGAVMQARVQRLVGAGSTAVSAALPARLLTHSCQPPPARSRPGCLLLGAAGRQAG